MAARVELPKSRSPFVRDALRLGGDGSLAICKIKQWHSNTLMELEKSWINTDVPAAMMQIYSRLRPKKNHQTIQYPLYKTVLSQNRFIRHHSYR